MRLEMVDLEVQECKGLDPNKIYIINVKNAHDLNPEAFGKCLMRFTNQLDRLNVKYAINIADYLELEISEIIPNNKFILNLSKENGDSK